jgi:hypothetical protein
MLWKFRNAVVFENEEIKPEVIPIRIHQAVDMYSQGLKPKLENIKQQVDDK